MGEGTQIYQLYHRVQPTYGWAYYSTLQVRHMEVNRGNWGRGTQIYQLYNPPKSGPTIVHCGWDTRKLKVGIGVGRAIRFINCTKELIPPKSGPLIVHCRRHDWETRKLKMGLTLSLYSVILGNFVSAYMNCIV